MHSFDSWIELLQASRASEARDLAVSENCLRLALQSASTLQGESSAEAGLCMVELAIFLKRNGKIDEAEKLSSDYKRIFGAFAGKD